MESSDEEWNDEFEEVSYKVITETQLDHNQWQQQQTKMTQDAVSVSYASQESAASAAATSWQGSGDAAVSMQALPGGTASASLQALPSSAERRASIPERRASIIAAYGGDGSASQQQIGNAAGASSGAISSAVQGNMVSPSYAVRGNMTGPSRSYTT